MTHISEKRILFHKLLYKIGAMECKAEILASYNVTSTTELTDSQLDEVIANLKKGLQKVATNNEIKTWRSNALTLLTKLHIQVVNGDWSGVNNYMSNKRIAGKKLNECNVDELKEVCRKLRSIIKKADDAKKKVFENNLCLN